MSALDLLLDMTVYSPDTHDEMVVLLRQLGPHYRSRDVQRAHSFMGRALSDVRRRIEVRDDRNHSRVLDHAIVLAAREGISS